MFAMIRRRFKSLCALLLGFMFSYSCSVWISQFLPLRCLLCSGICHQNKLRSKYLHQEKIGKRFILFSVMSSEENLETSVRSIWDTWGRHVPGKLIFFTGRMNKTDLTDLPIIQLDVKDDAYPQQIKSFTMLKYIFENFVDKYNWFVRADDDVYIKADRLSVYLKRVDSSQDILIGHPGIWKKEKLGLVGLGKDDNFCCDGPGIAMSSSVLRKIGPQLFHCLNSTASIHEDVKVSRCIKRFAGVVCPWAVEIEEYFYQATDDHREAFHGQLDTIEMEKTIIMHPVKDPAHMRRIHVVFLKQKFKQLIQKRLKLGLVLGKTVQSTKHPLQSRHISFHHVNDWWQSHTSSLLWEFFDFSKVWTLRENPPFRYIRSSTEIATKKIVGYAKETLLRSGEASLFYNVDGDKHHTGYMREDPTKGLEFLLDMPTKSMTRREGKDQVNQTRSLLHIRQNFGKLTHYLSVAADSKETVHFILPLMGRPEVFKKFLASFEKEFLIQGEPVKLLVIYFPDGASPVEQQKEFQSYAKKYPSVMIWKNFRGPFMKAAALQMGVNYFSNESLVLTCDVDVVFKREFANRCRETAVMGKRVYFPIVFSEYNPNITYAGKKQPGTHYHYTKEAGIWRTFGFGLCCAYAKDIHEVGGLKTELVGWGMEDVDLYDKFVKNDRIEIFRAPDPGLVHIYHPHVACAKESTVSLHQMCWSAQIGRYASASSVIDFFNFKGRLDFLVDINVTLKM